jgi:hypothetical protein
MKIGERKEVRKRVRVEGGKEDWREKRGEKESEGGGRDG